MFSLAISCLTTSNLPWFMDLTFQVPIQYCSLQHRTLFPSLVTSATGCCFCFGSVSSFFLELFLHSSLVAYWAPTTWGVHLSVFLPFHTVQSYGFSISHVWMWELDHKESWALRNWCFWTVVLEKTLESPLDSKEIQPVHSKGNQSWKFIGRADAEAENPILWSPDAKNGLTGKDSDAGQDWRQEEKGMTENEMVGWHHRLDGHESEQALGVGDEQESLGCCSPWGRKESDTTERLKMNQT